LQGRQRFSGAPVDGWWAPPLSGLADGPVPWTEEDLYLYLRTGHSPLHGVAAGPMAPVVDELASLPDEDIRAMATYLSSLRPKSARVQQELRSEAASALASAVAADLTGVGSRIYEGACAACHEDPGQVETFGVRPLLALNPSVHAPVPDNL